MGHSLALRSAFASIGLIIALSMLFVPSADAQKLSRFEVHGAYSLLHPNLPGSLFSNSSEVQQARDILGNLSGWNGGATVGITNSFGIAADFSGYYKSVDISLFGSSTHASARAHTFLFGPEFTKRGERLEPFGHGLFGVGHGSAKATSGTESGEGSKNAFTAAIGGGLDVKVHPTIAIRVGQLDYFPVHNSESKSVTFNNFRFVTGVVFYLSR